MGTKQAPPPAPDYAGAAQQTAQGNLNMAQYQTEANRVNQNTPYGSLTYSQGSPTFNQSGYNNALQSYQQQLQAARAQLSAGGFTPSNLQAYMQKVAGIQGAMPTRAQFTTPGQWTSTVNLSPQQQALLNSQQNLSQQYANIAQQGLNAVGNVMANPSIDKNLPQMPQNAGMTTQNAIMERLQPQIDKQNQMLDAKLANQGITPGSDAYNWAQRLNYQQNNDLLNQAALSGITTDMNARSQAIQNNAAIMNQPLNVINALRSGSQVSTPQFQNVPQQGYVGGPNYLGAMNQAYQTQLGNVNAQNAQQAGMFNTGASLLAAYMMS